jgi:DNA-binding MarR family transcriptional regulator
MNDFSFQLMKLQSLCHKQLLKGLEDTELSTGQPKVLAYLKSHEGKCQKEVAEACLIEPGSLTILLNRMEKQKMIERRFQGGNRKTRYIYLTEFGKEMADRVITRFYEVEEMAFNGFTEEQIKAFRDLCTSMIDNLELKK